MNPFLDNDRRRKVNKALEDYTRLVSIKFDLKSRTADVILSVSEDEVTDKVWEISDLPWPDARDRRYTFRLGNLSRIAVSTGKEELPKEIASVSKPDPRFMLFVASIFEESGIFEWQCFPDDNSHITRPYDGARWSYPLVEIDPSSQCYMELFKHRQNALWTIGLWFGTLQVDSMEPISIEEFLSRYPKRIGITSP